MDICPSCGKSVDGTTAFCTNCGTTLAREKSETSSEAVVAPPESHDSSITRSAPTASPSTTNRRVGRCKYCNKIIHVGDNPCPNCGHELNWKGQSTPKSSDTSQTTIPPNKEQGSLPSSMDNANKPTQAPKRVQSQNSEKQQGGDPGFAVRAATIPLMIIVAIVLFAIFVNELDKWDGSPEIVFLVSEVFFGTIPFVLSLAAYLSSRWRMQNKSLGPVCRGSLGLWSSILLAEGYWYGYYATFLVIYKDFNIGITRFCKYYDDDLFIWEVVLSLLVSFGLFFWRWCLRKQERLASEEDQKRRFTNIG